MRNRNTTNYSNSKRKFSEKRSSQLEAYHALIDSGHYGRAVDITLAAIKIMGVATRKMVSVFTGLENSSMTQFVKQLLKENKIHELPYKKPCEVTEKNVFWLKIGPKPPEEPISIPSLFDKPTPNGSFSIEKSFDH